MTLDVNKIICGDSMEVMPTFDNDVFDTIIIDPPYGLGFMGKDWDTFKEGSNPTYYKEKTVSKKRYHISAGKMASVNKPIASAAALAGSYDHSRNREFQQWFTLWAKEALRIAKPGAIMLCFGGTRTYHRLTCAIEDAGWQIRDCIMWLYGSGFPKSHNISKAIDKAKGKRKSISTGFVTAGDYGGRNLKSPNRDYVDIPPATDLAKQWHGYGTALKPAWEPIVVAMKPLDGTFAQNAEKWGVAGLNIDGGRIGTESHIVHGKEAGKFQPCGGETKKDYHEVQGRWPANVILDEQSAELLDEQSGVSKSTDRVRKNNKGWGDGIKYGKGKAQDSFGFADSGGASRFFYCAKASRSERNAGLKGIEEKRPDMRSDVGKGIWVEKGTAKQQNHHPTVKPLKLMEYLCELTKTPTGGVVLDCFGGSGTTGVACVNTGRDYVIIEKEPEYAEIGRRRVEYAKEQIAGQLALFEKG